LRLTNKLLRNCKVKDQSARKIKYAMYNKIVLSVLQKILSTHKKTLTSKTDFKSLGATPSELNWVLFETEQRFHIQLPESAITENSTIKDLIKTVVRYHI